MAAKSLPRLAPLSQYLCLNYIIALLNTAIVLPHIEFRGTFTYPFVAVILFTHALLYLMPVYGPVLFLDLLFGPRLLGRLIKPRWPSGVLIYTFAVAGFSLVQILLFADIFIFRLYGFHLNGFVWNLVVTRGGIESLGASPSTNLSVAIMVSGFVLLDAVLLILVLKLKLISRIFSFLLPARRAVLAASFVLILVIAQAVAYGVCSIKDYSPALIAADAFPMQVHITFGHFAERWFGIKMVKQEAFNTKGMALAYPHEPLALDPGHKHYNIVWLVAESWRRDMLAPDIMPATWAFSKRAIRFDQHYSSGNGTRMGMFGMFYGLYGPYWAPFLAERKGPVLLDLIVDSGYQTEMYTSAKFTYPEFERTIMARIPPQHLHELEQGVGWERDRQNVSDMLQFLNTRDRSRPFMTFMFFESPHAQYWFPPECAIRKPYFEDLNYVTMNLGPKEIGLVKNRYINSCNHLDTQYARILQYLEQNKLLDSTIIVMTGDHGEEFMENGRWGHNSTFSQQQTLVPLVLWIPGHPPAEITRMTSHLDLPATILAQLGVTNPPSDYSLGYDLLAPSPVTRPYTIISGYDSLCVVDPEYKAVFPVGSAGYREGQSLTTIDDKRVWDRAPYIESRRDRLMEIMRDLSTFRR